METKTMWKKSVFKKTDFTVTKREDLGISESTQHLISEFLRCKELEHDQQVKIRTLRNELKGFRENTNKIKSELISELLRENIPSVFNINMKALEKLVGQK
jgi:hypothetical protein